MRKIFLLVILPLVISCNKKNYNIIGNYQSKHYDQNYNYHFTENSNCELIWVFNEHSKFKRKGKFVINSDSININFDPIIQTKQKSKSADLNVEIITTNQNSEPIRNQPAKFFTKSGNNIVLRSDETGKISSKISSQEIDSIYLHYYFNTFSGFDLEHKDTLYNPNHKLIEFSKDYNIYEIQIDKNLMSYNFPSNKEILIINKNKRLYDSPEHNISIIIGGVLERKK